MRLAAAAACSSGTTIPTEEMRDRLVARHQRPHPLPELPGGARSPGVRAACLCRPGQRVVAHAGRRRRAVGASVPGLHCAAGVTSCCEHYGGRSRDCRER